MNEQTAARFGVVECPNCCNQNGTLICESCGEAYGAQDFASTHYGPALLPPASWECKDYADGWIPFAALAAALEYQRMTGCIMRPVWADGGES